MCVSRYNSLRTHVRKFSNIASHKVSKTRAKITDRRKPSHVNIEHTTFTPVCVLNRKGSETLTSIENPKQGESPPLPPNPLVILLPISPFFPLTSHRHPYYLGPNLCGVYELPSTLKSKPYTSSHKVKIPFPKKTNLLNQLPSDTVL